MAGYGLKSLKKNVATAGTRVQLSSSAIYAKKVFIVASTSNAGLIYIGGSDVSSTNGFPLANTAPGNRVDLGDLTIGGSSEAWDLSQVYVDAANNDEDVFVLYSVE